MRQPTAKALALCNEMERLANAATEGPELMRYDHGGGRSLVEKIPGRTLVADYYYEGDREFYHRSRTAVPELIALVRALVGERLVQEAQDRVIQAALRLRYLIARKAEGMKLDELTAFNDAYAALRTTKDYSHGA